MVQRGLQPLAWKPGVTERHPRSTGPLTLREATGPRVQKGKPAPGPEDQPLGLVRQNQPQARSTRSRVSADSEKRGPPKSSGT